jgi:hypothetical protein
MPEMNIRISNSCALFAYTLLVILPLWLALDRLIWVAGANPVRLVFIFRGELYRTRSNSIHISQALISTIATLAYWITNCMATREIQMAISISYQSHSDDAICYAINCCRHGFLTYRWKSRSKHSC